jgi:hypothetical protein
MRFGVNSAGEREREGDSALVLQMQMIAQRNGCEVEEQVDYSTT